MASLLQIIASTVRFEVVNNFTFRRFLVALILGMFPPTMLFLVLFVSQGAIPLPVEVIICIFVFIVGQLSLLLWATPNVYSELESRGWVYLTSRSQGRIGLMFGKYLAAVFNAWMVCVISMTICLVVADAIVSFDRPMPFIWLGFVGLITCASFAYGSIYSLIGVIFQKRSMVIGAVYAFVSDLILANIPALVSKLTIRYYLQGLSIKWLNIRIDAAEVDSDAIEILTFPSQIGVFWLLAGICILTAICLAVATYIIRYREYMMSDET